MQAEELKALRGGVQNPAPGAESGSTQRPAIIPATPIRPAAVPTHKNREENTNMILNAPKAPASYAKVAAERSDRQEKDQWTMVQKKGRPTEKKEIRKTEVSSRLMFIRQGGIDRIPEEDLMLELNTEIRRLKGVPQSVKTIKISYSEKGAISILLSDRSDVNKLLIRHRNRLIKAVRAVDVLVTGIEVVTKWYKIKLAGMPLLRYLPYGGIELLQREINSQIENPLMLVPRWIISPSRLYEES